MGWPVVSAPLEARERAASTGPKSGIGIATISLALKPALTPPPPLLKLQLQDLKKRRVLRSVTSGRSTRFKA